MSCCFAGTETLYFFPKIIDFAKFSSQFSQLTLNYLLNLPGVTCIKKKIFKSIKSLFRLPIFIKLFFSGDDGDFTDSDNHAIKMLNSAKSSEPLVQQALPNKLLPFVALHKDLLPKALLAEQSKEPKNPTCDLQLPSQLTCKVSFSTVNFSYKLLMNGYC